MRRLLVLCLLALCLSPAVASAADPPTVAVLYFDYTGKNQDLEVLRKGLAQMLISDLSGSTAIRVVERERLEDLLAELKLQASAKIDQQSAAKMGKLLGAKYLVLGGYFDLAGALRVDARIVDVETGRVFKSFGTNGKPGDFLPVEQKMATDLGEWFTANVPSSPPAPNAPAKKPPPKPPAALRTKTAVKYAEALSMRDSGKKEQAKAALNNVLQEQPDFALASLDLDRLMK